MERAVDVLLRLTRQPTGEAPWRTYHAAFVDRYGTGTLVPLEPMRGPGPLAKRWPGFWSTASPLW